MTLYEKVGRRYRPVRDTDAHEGLHNGCWLVVVEDGLRSTRRLLKPEGAEFLAVARKAEEAMSTAIMEASAARPRNVPLSQRERRAFEAWKAIMGEEVFCLQRDSAADIAEAGIRAVEKEWGKSRC